MRLFSIDRLPPIIGLTGFMKSGKSTAANILVERYGYTRYRFAGLLKEMLKALGLTAEEIDGSLKEKPCALLGGKTPRHAMITLGTEWGRNLIDGDLWVRAFFRSIEGKGLVVVDDVRFPNEADAIFVRGGLIWRIERGNAPLNSLHASEAGQLEIQPDLVIENNAGLIDLEVTLHTALEQSVWNQAN